MPSLPMLIIVLLSSPIALTVPPASDVPLPIEATTRMFLLSSIVIQFVPLSSFDLSHICKDLLLVVSLLFLFGTFNFFDLSHICKEFLLGVALLFLVSKVNVALFGGSDTKTLPFLS